MNCVFVMKQLDFLLLGMDQLTHTWNVLRDRKGLGSFTIFTVITDSGLEGKQSCFQRFEELYRCANVPGYQIHSEIDIKNVIGAQLINRGFRVITVEQTFLQKELEWS
jgi:hypothetical protein